MVRKSLFSSFTVRRVNETTFAVTEDDKWEEHPIIYVKLHPKASVIILSDTGCDAPSRRSKDAKYTHLRDFLESCPVQANDYQPLNPGSTRSYIVICSHCHYDHIGGIEQFWSSLIVASEQGRDFITNDLSTHSLCEFLDIRTPSYKVTNWAPDKSKLFFSDSNSLQISSSTSVPAPDAINLGITIYNTPGHTPDSLAFYDTHERHIYVGDSLYLVPSSHHQGENIYFGPIIFPKEGNWIIYLDSMRHLLDEMRTINQQRDDGQPRVKLSCGHSTVGEDAEDLLSGVLWFFIQILDGHVPVIATDEVRGEMTCLWHKQESKWAVSAPKRLYDEAREHREKCL